ncbi:hypothetical protein DOTSEDRAFT_153114 [Dothistroma septosporum NZE10]|uniref:Ubiquitin-like 1-activating enzyme E1A n=1 Tax=Dothistroma septosporum (strain NZE10 / CBS 128990) TaxID=675120 RepID=M2Y3P2_DOTSN|nr:hypothetical protein DOTSEDRAFT_153114 [Dothistroma septosporum NZE10]
MAQYDRQIRLWGQKAQERIRSANILLISLRALGTEIAKNLTLAGISSLTIVDDELVTEEDLGAQFFLREGDIGQQRAAAAAPRVQELNPRVAVKAESGNIESILAQNANYISQFATIIACDHDLMTLSTINTAANMAGIPFYAAGTHGYYGYIFADLVAHEFVIEREKSNVPTAITAETMTRSVKVVTNRKENNGKNIEVVEKQEIYCPLLLANSSPLPEDILKNRRKLKAVPALLPCLRALFEFQRDNGRLPVLQPQDLATFAAMAKTKSDELQLPAETLSSEFLKSFLQNIGAEITPTAAFVGGRLSEDVINVLGKREQPIQNFALFDGDALDGRIYCLYTPMMPMAPIDLNGMGAMDGFAMDANGMSMALDANGMPMMGAGMGMGMDMTMNGNMIGLNGFPPLPDLTAPIPNAVDGVVNSAMGAHAELNGNGGAAGPAAGDASSNGGDAAAASDAPAPDQPNQQ